MRGRLFLAAVIIMMPLPLFSVAAQEHGPPAGGTDKNLREANSDVKGRSNEMERVKRDIEKPNAPPPSSFDQIKEDFERIQIVNGDVLQANPASGGPNYGRISEAAAEISKRAIRLRGNLFSATPVKKSKQTGSTAENQTLKQLLAELDEAIATFTHSSMFQNTKVVNPDDSTKADKELQRIIKVSVAITLEADRLRKANSPSN